MSLDRLLRPKSVAVVGASTTPSFVSQTLANLKQHGFLGTVAAVNPRFAGSMVAGAPCYASLLDVPEPLDLLVVGIRKQLVPALLEDAERTGVGGLTMLTSGYAETGAEGRAAQDVLRSWADRTGILLAGPNCFGLMHAPTGLAAVPTVLERLVPGRLGLVLQSGMMVPSLLMPLFAREIGVSFAITTGNEAQLSLADYVDFLVDDDDTRVIGCFTEQIKEPVRFLTACERAADRGKPIVMLKIGQSERSRRSALAHTGSLVGSDAVVDAALARAGVCRVNTLDELLETSAIFHSRRLPRGSGLASVCVSGGAGGLLADLAAPCGVEFAELPETTVAALRQVVPEFGNVGNPLDITGQGVFQGELIERSVALMAEAPGVDLVSYVRGFPSWLDAESPTGVALRHAVDEHPATVFVVMSLSNGHLQPMQVPGSVLLEPTVHLDGVPYLQGAEESLRAIGALMRYAAFQRRRGEPAPARLTSTDVTRAARTLVCSSPSRVLDHAAGAELLALYGIPLAAGGLASTVDDALGVADDVGYPVAVKTASPDVPHKTDVGAVRVGVSSPDELRGAFTDVRAGAAHASSAATDADVLVQAMVSDADEVLLGMTRDEQFGPVVAIGLGGTLVEVLADTRLLLPPVSAGEAEASLRALRAYPMLAGARGRPARDVRALVDTMRRFAELCGDVGDLVDEIDLNPILVRSAGHGLCAVDWLIVRRSETRGG